MKSNFRIASLAAFLSRRPVLLMMGFGLVAGLTLTGALPASAQTNAPGQRRGRGQIDPSTLPPPKRAVIPKLSGPVKIDGEFNEPAWDKAVVLEPFFQNETGEPEHEHTQLKLWYDDQALYLGYLCRDADIHATFTNRDSHFWEEECVECFITPNVLNKYFEIEWNPLNGIFDAIISNTMATNGVSRRFDGDWSFTATNITNAVKVKGKFNGTSDHDEYWQVEVRIPFSDFGQPTPKPGDVWRANFYRFNRGTNLPNPGRNGLGEEQLAWSPAILSGFHQPTRFGYLEFGK